MTLSICLLLERGNPHYQGKTLLAMTMYALAVKLAVCGSLDYKRLQMAVSDAGSLPIFPTWW